MSGETKDAGEAKHKSPSFDEQVSGSGYPLQIAIGNLVEQGVTFGTDTWRVRFKEHAWTERDGNSSGFIDLVIENASAVVVFVVECKRFREANWLFLSSSGKRNETARARVWSSVPDPSGSFVSASASDPMLVRRTPRHFGWAETNCGPRSPEVEFCVPRKEKPSDTQGLEKIASNLVTATEALAAEELPLLSMPGSPSTRVYIPLIVSTADLRVCEFDPATIPMSSGDVSGADYAQCALVRFRKQLSTKHPEVAAPLYDNARMSRAKERTVFIVRAPEFERFLAEFTIERPSVGI